MNYKNEHFFIDSEQIIPFKLKISVISEVSNISIIDYPVKIGRFEYRSNVIDSPKTPMTPKNTNFFEFSNELFHTVRIID